MVLELKAQRIDFTFEGIRSFEIEALGILARRTRLVDRVAQGRGEVPALLRRTPAEALGNLDPRDDLDWPVEVFYREPAKLRFFSAMASPMPAYRESVFCGRGVAPAE